MNTQELNKISAGVIIAEYNHLLKNIKISSVDITNTFDFYEEKYLYGNIFDAEERTRIKNNRYYRINLTSGEYIYVKESDNILKILKEIDGNI